MANLRDELLKLTNPTPVFKDLEDNSDDDTNAKVVDQDVDNFEEITQPSKLRQKTAIILADTDKRYAGKKTSRKNFDADLSDDDGEDMIDSDDDDDDDDDDNVEKDDESGSDDRSEMSGDYKTAIDDDNNDEDDDDDSVDEDAMMTVHGQLDKDFQNKFSSFGSKKFSFKDDGDYSKYADDDEDDDEEDEDDDSDDDENDDDSGRGDEEDDDVDEDDDEEIDSEDEGIQKFSSTATDEVAKGNAAKHQLGLWDSLLEGRIKLQKAVSIVNQLPKKQTWSEFEQKSNMFEEEAGKVQQALGHLLGSLVHLQDLMLNQNPETKHIFEGKTDSNKKSSKLIADEDDEEIPSDTDEEMDMEEKKPVSSTIVRKRKLKFEEYPDVLKKRHCSFTEYRNATIQKWYDKTRLAAGKVKGKSFSAFDQSAIVQINQILADKERLVKRTQLKRTMYRVLGTQSKPDQPDTLPSEQGDGNVTEKDNHLKDNDTEIFDDDDFYHQLLRELIEKKTSDVNDPVALSRQWLQIQKLRSKNKKAVDNRASKGRKIRYDIHKKLVNFMAPIDDCKWSHEARDDLFKSLFGKRFSGNNL